MTMRSAPVAPTGDAWLTDPLRLVLQLRWRPDTDTYETPTTIEIIVDLAGVDEEDLEVQLFEDALVLEGRRPPPSCQEGAVYQAVGIRQGPFQVSLPLAARIDPERVEARFHRGLLRVTLPKLLESG